jgi:hypothetical protein
MSDEVDVNCQSQSINSYLSQLLREAREDVLHADSKASMILAALGVGIGATLGGVIASDWKPSQLSNWVEWVWWMGAAILTISILTSASSVWPRYQLGQTDRNSIYFWGDTNGLSSTDELLEVLKEHLPDLGERGADQFLKLSSIVITKYKLIRRALLAAGIGALLCCLAVLLDAL